MRTMLKLIAVPALVLAAACGRNDAQPADAALQNDLALAGNSQPYAPQQIVSPQEQGYAPQALQRTSTGYSAPIARPVYRRTASTTSRSRSSGVRYPQPAAEPVRHTQRDAVIGASAGAIIGATTSRDKVKGGLIGAAAGGILGAVVGHTVDVERP